MKHYFALPPHFLVLDDGEVPPVGAIEITAQRHRELMDAQATGSEIVAGDDGQPTTRLRIAPEVAFQSAVGAAVDQLLDGLAQSWRYRDYISARSYRDDPNPRFAAEAAALIAHGSACWTVLDQLESAVLAGTAQMPGTVEEVLALLPDPPDRPGV